jgi:hypothetical protein
VTEQVEKRSFTLQTIEIGEDYPDFEASNTKVNETCIVVPLSIDTPCLTRNQCDLLGEISTFCLWLQCFWAIFTGKNCPKFAKKFLS